MEWGVRVHGRGRLLRNFHPHAPPPAMALGHCGVPPAAGVRSSPAGPAHPPQHGVPAGGGVPHPSRCLPADAFTWPAASSRMARRARHPVSRPPPGRRRSLPEWDPGQTPEALRARTPGTGATAAVPAIAAARDLTARRGAGLIPPRWPRPEPPAARPAHCLCLKYCRTRNLMRSPGPSRTNSGLSPNTILYGASTVYGSHTGMSSPVASCPLGSPLRTKLHQ